MSRNLSEYSNIISPTRRFRTFPNNLRHSIQKNQHRIFHIIIYDYDGLLRFPEQIGNELIGIEHFLELLVILKQLDLYPVKSLFLLTASFSLFVSTPYNSARSEPSIT